MRPKYNGTRLLFNEFIARKDHGLILMGTWVSKCWTVNPKSTRCLAGNLERTWCWWSNGTVWWCRRPAKRILKRFSKSYYAHFSFYIDNHKTMVTSSVMDTISNLKVDLKRWLERILPGVISRINWWTKLTKTWNWYRHIILNPHWSCIAVGCMEWCGGCRWAWRTQIIRIAQKILKFS